MAKLNELSQWRKKQGLTQAQLGAKLSRHQVLISDWEKGARPIAQDALQELRALGYDGPAESAAPMPATNEQLERHAALLMAEISAMRDEIRALREQLGMGGAT